MKRETKKTTLIKILADLRVQNWVLTGFNGCQHEAKELLSKSMKNLTIKQLENMLENLTIVS